MSYQLDDSPYRDESAPSAPPRNASRNHRSSRAHTSAAVEPSSPPPRNPRAHQQGGNSPVADGEPTRPRRRSRRKSRHGATRATPVHLTSHPTGRAAYVQTREWLIEQHGSVCAYCGKRFEPGSMTLDHVAPRRGQTAFDRRDNLVLACTPCNAAKRDLAPAAFLLGNRARAANLLRYGAHLSPMLVDLARSLAPDVDLSAREPLDLEFDDDESPYRD